MPIYEYQCEKCSNVFEEWQTGFEEKDQECPECGGSAKRLISNTSFVLKGSGWYVTEYGGKREAGQAESGSSDSGGEGGEAAASGSDTGAGASPAAETQSQGGATKSAPEGASSQAGS
ncbi:FmdB family zinc ribbon protein [Salidesulfovibrio brasiliensis]|uniref:FmdB family zinc ribbon protein n=1 Tax=Salidesulfovibrio brasiliensis TaxID=221711 RepID=UPI0006D2C7A7|nr:zinc ribbon domain-containing protein [Salidesulfovibrio brasiliensis]